MKYGIMQGRLSPSPTPGALQFFPADWREEFRIACRMGFELIEWIVDDPLENNPLWGEGAEIVKMGVKYGVQVKTLCADYFMRPGKGLNCPNAMNVVALGELIKKAHQAQINTIGIPFVEEHSLEEMAQRMHLQRNLEYVLPSLQETGVELALEIDLEAKKILELVTNMDTDLIGVCYDTGNATTFGRNLAKDIEILAPVLKEVHLKDRITGTRQSVHLGSGDANLEGALQALKEIGFNGPCVLQAWRGDLTYLDDASNQLKLARTLSY